VCIVTCRLMVCYSRPCMPLFRVPQINFQIVELLPAPLAPRPAATRDRWGKPTSSLQSTDSEGENQPAAVTLRRGEVWQRRCYLTVLGQIFLCGSGWRAGQAQSMGYCIFFFLNQISTDSDLKAKQIKRIPK
jgi:hypothetical protein